MRVAEVRHRESANIWVVPDEDAVATRFLFVYRGEALQARERRRVRRLRLDREVRARRRLKSARRPVTPAPRTARPYHQELPPPRPSARRSPGRSTKWLGKTGVPRIMSEFRRASGRRPRVFDVELVGDGDDVALFGGGLRR